MYDNCVDRSRDPVLLVAMGLEDSFNSRYVLLTVHIWLCLMKLRSVGPDGKKVSQTLFDNFWDDMVSEIRLAGVRMTTM